MDKQMKEWIVMCTEMCSGPYTEQGELIRLLTEGKSPLLNACAKEFGEDVIYDVDCAFQMNEKNLNTLFKILDRSVFNNKLSKLKGLQIYIGGPSYLNPIAEEYQHANGIDLSDNFAAYIPELKFFFGADMKNGRRQILDIEKVRDGIFLNVESNPKSTFAYALATLCHEMIHCLDMNEGLLKEKTKFLLNQGADNEVISYTSHFTPLFKSKRETMKNQHGITIQITGDDMKFVEMNRKAAEEIQHLREEDQDQDLKEWQELYDKLIANPDYYNEKYKDVMHFDPESGHLSFIFAQKIPKSSLK